MGIARKDKFNLEIESAGARRRRKTVRSCTFCRQRKLKCDQQKPMCGSCKARKLPECFYTDGFNFQLTSEELFSGSPNVALMKRIRELERVLASTTLDDCADTAVDAVPYEPDGHGLPGSVASSGSTASGGSSIGSAAATSCSGLQCDPVTTTLMGMDHNSINPSCGHGNKLLSFRTLKDVQGGIVLRGATSIGAAMLASGEQFIYEYNKVWQRVQNEVETWKVVQGQPFTFDQALLEQPLSGSILDAVVADLPTFDTIKDHLQLFFQSPLHDHYHVLDEAKVMADFERCFVPGYLPTDASVQGKPIVMLLSGNDKTIYAPAIVLIVLCLTYYKTDIPPSFERLITFLCGWYAIETSCVERVQFLLMLYILKLYNGHIEKNCAQMWGLVSNLCATALSLGMHMDIDNLYANEELRGGTRIETLHSMWYWILFADVNVSFDRGFPLIIDSCRYDDNRLPCESKTREGLLRNYLHIARKTMHTLYDKNETPQIVHLVSNLTTFIEKHFRPIRYYTDVDLIQEVDLFDISILSQLLAIVANCFSLTRMLECQMKTATKNGFIKYVILSISLAVTTVRGCFEMDRKLHSTMIYGKYRYLTPYTNLSVLLLNSAPFRALTELYGLLFYKVTLFEKGLIVSTDEGIFDLDLTTLEVPDGQFFSFRGVFNKFCSIFDEMLKPECDNMARVLWRSHVFVTTMALERVNRAVFQVGLQTRTQVEIAHNWSQMGPEDFSDEIMKSMSTEATDEYNKAFLELMEMDPSEYLTEFQMTDD
ncbi:LAMI_0B06942g1_1 [Lachancea mirantina]|uniref:LAMI_0B06942g1_1 n=1 Tax=Lachancea mirantina TaxID=1230905 RepID=A0A1G4IX12_9SACH|nr:LAMI_0B06942g1_1 [Lachancea mirantina]